MEKFTVVECTAPSFWASYLINGDASSFEDEGEQEAADAWIKRINCGSPVDCKDAGFLRYHDADEEMPLAADCQTYSFLVPNLPFVIRRKFYPESKSWELFASFPTIPALSSNWYDWQAEAENGDSFACSSEYWNASKHVLSFDKARVAAFEARVRKIWENDADSPCRLIRYERMQSAWNDARKAAWNNQRAVK